MFWKIPLSSNLNCDVNGYRLLLVNKILANILTFPRKCCRNCIVQPPCVGIPHIFICKLGRKNIEVSCRIFAVLPLIPLVSACVPNRQHALLKRTLVEIEGKRAGADSAQTTRVCGCFRMSGAITQRSFRASPRGDCFMDPFVLMNCARGSYFCPK